MDKKRISVNGTVKRAIQRGSLAWMSDETYLRIMYRLKLGKKLNLKDPETFTEKLQWLKLHDHNPVYTTMADKYAAKGWIAERVGEGLTVPTLGVWEHFDEIDFSTLPDQFVLKCTHDSGGLVIVKDKAAMDRAQAKEKIENCLNNNFFWSGREWAYKDIQKKIIAEPYLVDESGVELKDYKIFCFNGKPEYVEVDFNRFVKHKLNTYDFDWNPLNFCDTSKSDYSADIKRPARLDDMKRIAAILSQDMRFLRVDFYSIYDKFYIGELTLYPGCGMIAFDPPEKDLELGKLLKL